jgi:hypothetical protein
MVLEILQSRNRNNVKEVRMCWRMALLNLLGSGSKQCVGGGGAWNG